jgi:hypothetical protein
VSVKVKYHDIDFEAYLSPPSNQVVIPDLQVGLVMQISNTVYAASSLESYANATIRILSERLVQWFYFALDPSS